MVICRSKAKWQLIEDLLLMNTIAIFKLDYVLKLAVEIQHQFASKSNTGNRPTDPNTTEHKTQICESSLLKPRIAFGIILNITEFLNQSIATTSLVML